MAQMVIRNLDEELVADYRAAAARNRRSMEAEVREMLRIMRPKSPKRVEELLERLAKIRAMTPAGVKQTPSEDLVREDRDGYRW